MKARTILIAAGLVVGGLAWAGYEKVKRFQAAFEKMTIYPSKITNIKFGFLQIDFKLSFKITNPTDEDFSVSAAGLVTLNKINVYRKGDFLGTAILNIDALELPAKQTITIENLPFSVASIAVIETALTMESFNVNDLTIEAIVSVMGKEFTIVN